jgi:hypothetical protein
MPAIPAEPASIMVDGRHPLTIEDVVAVARGTAVARLSDAVTSSLHRPWCRLR